MSAFKEVGMKVNEIVRKFAVCKILIDIAARSIGRIRPQMAEFA